MIGTILNVAGIVIGGVAGLARRQPFSAQTESLFRVLLGVFTVAFGLVLTWKSLNGPFSLIVKQVLVVLLALMLGKLTGRALRLQKLSNRLGHIARDHLSHPPSGKRDRMNAGFETCSALYCAAPLGLLGAVQDGLGGYFYPLAVKGVMEGLATAGFARIFGWGALLSALPVLAIQGTLSLLVLRFVAPFLETHNLVDAVNATGGLLVFSVGLVIFELKRIELTDYLPSLIMAPLLTWLLR